MKSIATLLAITSLATVAYAQTNLWQNSGNIGIGTTSPNYKLDVVGTQNISGGFGNPDVETAYRLKFWDNGGIYNDTGIGIDGGPFGSEVMWFNALNGFYFNYGTGGQRITFSPVGNVGIGTTNPTGGRLVAYDTSKPSIAWGASSDLGFLSWGSSNEAIVRSANALKFQTNGGGTDAMWLTTGGNIGVGTSSPGAKLDITNCRNGTTSLAVLGGGSNATTLVSTTLYPSITESGTNYIRNIGFYSWELPIASGVTDNGYRIGLDVENFVADPNFLGTLSAQFGLWARVGSYAGGNGTILNSYGVLIENLDGPATVVNKYGLYQSNGTAKNYFAGNVGIGTTSPSEKLSVNGKIRAKEVVVETTNWSDHVFADSYQLQSLSEVEQHIKTEKHLPGVPSAQEVAEKGVSVGDMQAILLAKIEELTLHQIAQEKAIGSLQNKVQSLETENAQLKAQIR